MFTPTPARLLLFATSLAMVAICTGFALRGGSTALTVVTVRTLGVLAILAIYVRVAGIAISGPTFSIRDRVIALAIGLSLCTNNYSMNASLTHIPIPLAVLIFYTWPAIITIASWVLGKERFSLRGLAGTLLAFAGLALALNVDFTAGQRTGVLLALFSALSWSLTAMLVGHFFKGRDARPVTLWMTMTGAAAFVIATLATGDFVWPRDMSGSLGLAAIAFFFAFGMIGLFTATATIGAARAGFFMNFEPLAAVVLSAALLGQVLAPIQLAGAALVMVALFLFRPPILKRS